MDTAFLWVSTSFGQSSFAVFGCIATTSGSTNFQPISTRPELRSWRWSISLLSGFLVTCLTGESAIPVSQCGNSTLLDFCGYANFDPPNTILSLLHRISSAHIAYAWPPFTSTCAVPFLDLNFALSGYGGSNLDPFYGYGLDPNSPTKMSIPYFWLYIWVLSIPGWNLAKYFGLLPLAVTLRVWRLALLLRLLLAAYPFLGISLRLQLALLAFGFWVFFH